MGKKGGWFSAIKKVFTHSSKDKPTDGSSSDKKNSREKKKGKGILRHSENRSFIPLFKEPSSIEKILGEADQLFIRPSHVATASSEQQNHVRTDVPDKLTLSRIASPPKSASVSDSLPVNAVSSSSSSSRVNNNASSPKAEKSAPLRAASASSKVIPQKPVVASPSNDARNPKVVIERENQKKMSEYARRPEPTLRYQQLLATKIQAAFRGYLARRSFRALRGLVRLQGVVRGQNVRRQTANAMKQMQLLVRVQTQIQSRRIQMLENQAIQQPELHKNNKEIESTLSKWTNQLSEMGNENWDDSVLTKEEADMRLRKKVEAVIKRERAMAYAYSHKLWRANPNSAQAHHDIRSNGFPWWWNWLERQFPETTPTSHNQTYTKNDKFALTPTRSVSEYNNNNGSSNRDMSHANNYKSKIILTPENQESLTPRSSRSQAMSTRGKQFSHHTPSRTPPQAYNSSASSIKYTKPTRVREVNSSYYNDVPLKDDDSLVSCPPFSAPSYMMPTVSAKAKVRSNSNPKDRFMGTPGNEPKKRFSFPLTPKWSGNNKSSYNGSVSNQRVLEKRDSSRSIGDLSVDSTVSMPAIVGRKPFNRFV